VKVFSITTSSARTGVS